MAGTENKGTHSVVGMTRNMTNKAIALNTSLGLSEEDKHLIFLFLKSAWEMKCSTSIIGHRVSLITHRKT